jgi:hypothetical protein
LSVRVNTVSIGATGSGGALAATIPAGTGIIAGDVIVACCMSDGTHVANGMVVQDSTNLTNFTTIKEQQLGSANARWIQTFFYVAAANVPDGATITLTPFAAATVTAICVDIFRYALGTVTNAAVGNSNTASTSQAAPALGAAPAIGNLVLTFDGAVTGTLTPGGAFTAGSAVSSAGTSVAIGFASADGTSTFASTWTDSSSQVSATETVGLQNAGVGVPYAIGSTAQAAGSSSTVVNITKTTNSGDALFCCVGCGAGSAVTPTGVTDTGSHTWTQIGSFAAANGMACYIYQSLHATAVLTSGVSTVTVTWSGTTYAKFVEVIACAGINQTVALDQTGTALRTSSAPSATTSMGLANNNELVLAVITSGSASAGITWASPMVAMDAGLHVSGGVYMSVGTQVITNSTAAVTAGATLGATAVWGELLVTLLPDPPIGPAGTVTITNTSPLTAGQVGVAYTNQLNVTGGAPPYTWSVSAGSLPPGLTLEPGGGGGGSGDFTFVGANTGPQGAPTVGGFTTAYPTIGPIGAYKVFFSSMPSSWSGTLMDQITQAKPGTFTYICWNDLASQATFNNFAASIPHSVQAVGFCWNSEPENTGGSGLSASTFQSGWRDQMTKVHNAQSVTPVQLVTISTSYLAWYQQGGSNAWIPPTDTTDVYGFDFYDRHTYNVGPDMGSTNGWRVWTGYVRNLGKPLAITEFGLSGYGTDAAQNTRLQADLAYLKTAFGPGGTLSQLPLYIWLYWATGINGGGGSINDFLGPLTKATWKGIAGTQSGSGGTGTGGGGLLIGTPSTTAGSPFSFTAKATDSATPTPAFGTKAFSLTVTSSSALAVTTAALDPGTTGASYSNILEATGGAVPYTWAVTVGTLPAGLSLTPGTGVIAGTPTTPGTSSFTVRVTDNVSATATAALSITISSALTITTATLPNGTTGTAYTATLTAANGTPPYAWGITAGSLPAGLALDPAAGTITGTPTAAGVSTFTIAVADSSPGGAATASKVFTISIASSGGIQAPGRRKFGGTQADWTFTFGGFSADSLLRAPGATVTFWTALIGGSQYTDLQNTGGGAITSVVTDANGELPELFGPAGVWKMAADAGGGTRRWVVASDFGDFLGAVYTSLVNLGG